MLDIVVALFLAPTPWACLGGLCKMRELGRLKETTLAARPLSYNFSRHGTLEDKASSISVELCHSAKDIVYYTVRPRMDT